LQLMLLQEDQSGVQILPCFPADRSVRFLLHRNDGRPLKVSSSQARPVDAR
jgi:hypothetical protein